MTPKDHPTIAKFLIFLPSIILFIWAGVTAFGFHSIPVKVAGLILLGISLIIEECMRFKIINIKRKHG